MLFSLPHNLTFMINIFFEGAPCVLHENVVNFHENVVSHKPKLTVSHYGLRSTSPDKQAAP